MGEEPGDGSNAPGAGFSQHPTDRLIRELIRARRAATPREVEWIVDRMATAPFNPAIVPVKLRHQGLAYQGRTLGSHADSLTYHLVQRVVADDQWRAGTTAEQFVADLRAVVRAPGSRLAVFERRGGGVAVTIAPTNGITPPMQTGGGALPHLIVVYAADRGCIITGYQFSKLDQLGIPEGAQWLK